MQLVEIKYGTDLYWKELALRDEMLRKPIGLAHSEADLTKEPGYQHFGLILDEQLVACLMVVPHPLHRVQIRQMAVSQEFQGSGYGRFLMKAVEALLREDGGIREIFLNARHTAVGFYRKLGYEGEGELFTEVGIPHLQMRKRLDEGL